MFLVLCLPELCITAYGCQDLFLHDWVSETALERLSSIIPFSEGIDVVVGLPIIFEGSTYNGLCYLSNGEIKGFYCKQFLANDGIHYEKRWFEPWPIGKKSEIKIEDRSYPIGDIIIESYGLKIGFEICGGCMDGE